MKIGFIGLGIMGKPMAKNLIRHGFSLTVSNHNVEISNEFEELGAEVKSNAEIAKEADVLLTMLPDSPQVYDVLLGSENIASYMKKGSAVIDMSSIDPLVSQKIGKKLANLGIEMLDAPVSGGEPKAIDGTLSFMVGGKEAIFNEYKPILECMGSSINYCGDLGSGNTTKLANQVIVACNIQALAEGMLLAKAAGVNPERVFNAIRGGLAGSTVMEAKTSMMIESNFEPGFRIDLHIKDLTNALSVGHGVGAYLPMTSSVKEIMHHLSNTGFGSKDHSALLKYYELVSGIKLSDN